MHPKNPQAGLPARRKALCAAIALACLAPGCATDPKTGRPSIKETFASDDPCSNNARNIGIVGGAVLGAILANKMGNGSTKTTVLGAAAGAAVGGLIGHSMDARRCEIAKLSKQYGMTVRIEAIPKAAAAAADATPDQASAEPAATPVMAAAAEPQLTMDSSKAFKDAAGMSIAVQDDARQFAVDSDRLEPKAREYFSKIAEQYAQAKQLAQLNQRGNASDAERQEVEALSRRRLLLVGHTDDTGSSSHNAELSERRARAVGEVFRLAGVADVQIYYQGAGETLPVADNRSEAGRARNRRVEIVDLADEQALRAYLDARRPRLAFYRPAPQEGSAATSGKLASATDTAAANAKPGANAGARASTGQSPTAVKPASPGKSATDKSRPVPEGSLAAATPSTAAKPTALAFDFGGAPASVSNAGVDVGSIAAPGPSFSLIPSAHAAGAQVPPSCADDRPREARGVKSLRDQKDISFTELMPGLFGSTWSDSVNGNLVSIANVAVYRDGGQPAAKPTVLVYKDFKGNRDAKADFRAVAEVNTYRGEKALLYRVFVGGPVRCLDMVMPYAGSRLAQDAQLLYPRDARLYVASFRPGTTAR